MPTLGEVMNLGARIERNATDWYTVHRVPVAFQRAHPMVLARAALESGEDWRRCVIDPDGSITVFNHAVWTPEVTR